MGLKAMHSLDECTQFVKNSMDVKKEFIKPMHFVLDALSMVMWQKIARIAASVVSVKEKMLPLCIGGALSKRADGECQTRVR